VFGWKTDSFQTINCLIILICVFVTMYSLFSMCSMFRKSYFWFKEGSAGVGCFV
jgi:hypothetical protein